MTLLLCFYLTKVFMTFIIEITVEEYIYWNMAYISRPKLNFKNFVDVLTLTLVDLCDQTNETRFHNCCPHEVKSQIITLTRH